MANAATDTEDTSVATIARRILRALFLLLISASGFARARSRILSLRVFADASLFGSSGTKERGRVVPPFSPEEAFPSSFRFAARLLSCTIREAP